MVRNIIYTPFKREVICKKAALIKESLFCNLQDYVTNMVFYGLLFVQAWIRNSLSGNFDINKVKKKIIRVLIEGRSHITLLKSLLKKLFPPL